MYYSHSFPILFQIFIALQWSRISIHTIEYTVFDFILHPYYEDWEIANKPKKIKLQFWCSVFLHFSYVCAVTVILFNMKFVCWKWESGTRDANIPFISYCLSYHCINNNICHCWAQVLCSQQYHEVPCWIPQSWR